MRLAFLWVLMTFCSWNFAVENTVENDREPKGKTVTLVFTEDLRFGSDEEGLEYLWADPSSLVEADANGNIYVGDVRDRRILQFDKDGQFVKFIAKQGQGPGELQALADLSILKDGSMIALNSGPGVLPKFLFFDQDMKYKDTKAPEGFSKVVVSSEFAPDGKIFAGMFLAFDMEKGTMKMKVGALDMNFEVLKQLSERDQSFDPAAFQSPQGLSKFLSDTLRNAYKGTGMMHFDKEGNAYSAISNDYTITKWSPDLSTKLMVIKRKYKPIPNTEERIDAIAENTLDTFRNGPLASMITDQLKKNIIEKAELPIVVNPVNGIITMEDGHLLVVHDVNFATGEQIVDIFNAKGEFQGQSTMDSWAFYNRNGLTSMIFKNGFAYCLETDDLGDNRVVRYKYEFK